MTPIVYHFVMTSTRMTANLKPTFVRCESREQALESAQNLFHQGAANENFGCLKVFSDGSVDYESFSEIMLQF